MMVVCPSADATRLDDWRRPDYRADKAVVIGGGGGDVATTVGSRGAAGFVDGLRVDAARWTAGKGADANDTRRSSWRGREQLTSS